MQHWCSFFFIGFFRTATARGSLISPKDWRPGRLFSALAYGLGLTSSVFRIMISLSASCWIEYS